MSGILLVFVFLGLLILGMPIAFAIAITAMTGIWSIPAIPLIAVPQKMTNGLNSFVLLAVPLFILAANIMNSGKISKKMIDFSTAMVGRVKGGLAHANIIVSMIFAGVSGSSAADAAGIGRILIPNMVETGYDKETSVGVTAASSVIGIIIPPSIPMVVYAGIANCSVAGLFIGGLVPGILIGLAQMLVVFLLSFSHNYPVYGKSSFKEFITLFAQTVPALLTPIIIIGGVITGFYTPTESAAFAAIYAFLISKFFYKTLKMKDLPVIIRDTMLQTGQALFALAAASALGELMGYYRVSNYVNMFFSENINSTLVFLLLVIAFYLFIGTFMDNLPALILFTPVLLPTAVRLGISPIMLGVISVITLAVGLVTPPYGICLLITSAIGGLNVSKSFTAVIPYILAILAVLVLLLIFPQLVMTLPRMLENAIRAGR